MQRLLSTVLVVILCACPYATHSLADDASEWGHVRGRFVYDGPLPEVRMFPVTTDKEAFGDEIADESLVVHPENKGIANVVVFLLPDADAELRVHPSYDDEVEAKVVLAMHKGRFAPHVMLVRTTQTLVVRNEDEVGHCARMHFKNNGDLVPLIPVARDTESKLNKEESSPCAAACMIHPWMSGYVLVRANPYMAVSNEDGQFEIKNLPVGKHVLQFWHERVGWLREVKIGMHKTDNRGRLTVTIAPGDNDLNSAELPPEVFEKVK
jgi:hypothetical protein